MSSSEIPAIRKDRVRLVILMHPKDGVSFEEFDRYWLTEHASLFLSIDIVKKNLLKYEQFHFNPATNKVLAEMGVAQTSAAGMVIFEAESFEKIFEIFEDADYQRIVIQDEMKFFDREKSQLIAGEYATILGY